MARTDEIQLNDTTAHPLARYRNHIEFSGYRVEEDAESLFGRHPRKPNLILKPITERGVLVSTMYSFKAQISRPEILEYINQLNASFLFMKAFLDDEGGVYDLVLDTFFEGEYNRTNFSILLENIDHDMIILRNHERSRDYLE